MSHSVTIRTQTMTSSSTAVIINSGYLKTWSGAVKLLQLVRPPFARRSKLFNNGGGEVDTSEPW